MRTYNFWQNPIYKKYLSDNRDRYVFCFGGAGSGKSIYSIQKFIFEYFLKFRNQKLFMARKVGKYVQPSIWAEVQKLLTKLGLWRQMKVNLTNKTIFDPVTKNEIIMMGMDDPEKIKSIPDITKAYLEEADAFDESDFIQVDLRMRGELAEGDFFQLWASFNPCSRNSWLVKYVEPQYLPEMPTNISELTYLDKYRNVWRFATTAENGTKLYTTTVNTTYKHNEKIDAAYVSRLQTLASFDQTHYQVYERGRWGEVNAGDRYCPAFMESLHVHKLDYVPQQPIHYTLDFNVKPYMSGLCIQLIYNNNEYQVRVFKQFALQHPENTAYHLGANFIANFQEIINFGVYLYGDASGNNSLGVKDTKSLFADVKNGFGYYASLVEDRIPTSNPRYAKIAPGALGRRTFLNACFANNGTIPIRVLIDPSCTELISDLRLCTQDANGKLAKPKKNGIEERGHMLQALEYFICHKESLGELAIL